MKKTAFSLAIVMAVGLSASAQFVPQPLPTGSETFCGYFQSVYTNPILGMLGPEYAQFTALLLPQNADINGASYVIQKNPYPDGDLAFALGTNQMLDCYFELKLIEVVAKNTSYNNGTVTYAQVAAAWAKSDQQFYLDVGSVYWPLLGGLVGGLKQILLGEMTVGDGDAVFSDFHEGDGYNRIDCTGSAGFIKAIMFLLGDNITNFAIDLADYGIMPDVFGKDGDADGDGCTNWEEYVWVKGNNPSDTNDQLAPKYAAAALDPLLKPNYPDHPEHPCTPKPAVPAMSLQGGGWLELGDKLTFKVLGAPVGSTFVWTKNGANIGGNSDTFEVLSVTTGDAGSYGVSVDDHQTGKAVTVLGPVTVTIFPAASLPVAALGGLALAAMAFLSAGASVISRRK